MARKKIECGPPYELSTKYVLNKIWQGCKVCDECGNVSHWTGCTNGRDRSKQGTFPITVNGKTYQVRRIIWASMGKTFQKNDRIVTSCQNPRCIAPDLLKRIFMRHIQRDAVKAGKIHTPQSRLKTSRTKQAAVGKLTDEMVRSVYADSRSAKEIAEDLNVSLSYIRGIKTGHVRTLAFTQQNPFAGLGARS